MRISDWSSDVCSSDLNGAKPIPYPSPTTWKRKPTGLQPNWKPLTTGSALSPSSGAEGGRMAEPRQATGNADAAAKADRKSVVEGKSVTVRVDLGGTTNHKKKNDIYIMKTNSRS